MDRYTIHNSDNVEVDLKTGMKYAVEEIPLGADVIKYGYKIGTASKEIKKGELVHTDNLKTSLKSGEDYSSVQLKKRVPAKALGGVTFKGYLRKNGGAGIRNDIFIIPTVGCVNGLCRKIAGSVNSCSGVDNIIALEHPYGCSQLGGDHESTKLILSNLAKNPNAGGVLVVALGCENNTLEDFKKALAGYDPKRVRFIRAQDEGDELESGSRELADLIKICRADKKSDIDISKLIIGIKCGGSDAFSGITANPLVGRISERLTALGASVIMTEVPEMFGAEHILMQNAENLQIKKRIEELIFDFKRYYTEHGESVAENPSPGNKEGGITTLEEKSLGCVQKGGDCVVVDVLKYTERVKTVGLTLLEGPGNDIVAVSALAAAGANLILFTTGRGTPLGAPVPVIKISSNSALADKKMSWTDFDAGRLTDGDAQAAADELLKLILDTASGKKTRSEENNYFDFAIWKNGVTL